MDFFNLLRLNLLRLNRLKFSSLSLSGFLTFALLGSWLLLLSLSLVHLLWASTLEDSTHWLVVFLITFFVSVLFCNFSVCFVVSGFLGVLCELGLASSLLLFLLLALALFAFLAALLNLLLSLLSELFLLALGFLLLTLAFLYQCLVLALGVSLLAGLCLVPVELLQVLVLVAGLVSL